MDWCFWSYVHTCCALGVENDLFFCHASLSSGDWSHVTGLGSKCLYMLSHLASPERLLLPPLESLCILLLYNFIRYFILLLFNTITNYFISSFSNKFLSSSPRSNSLPLHTHSCGTFICVCIHTFICMYVYVHIHIHV